VKFLKETDVEDAHGNIVIHKGLKVRHKNSQLEYTVEDVIGAGDDLSIVLRLPDQPRFDNPAEPEEVIVSKNLKKSNVIFEYEVTSDGSDYYFPEEEVSHTQDFKQSSEVEMMSVTKKEFEKDYEVK
jgi:hypothetical protein